MSLPPEPMPPGFARFRARLLVAMMLVVTAVTGAGLWFAQRSAAQDAAREFQREFQDELASLHAVHEERDALLAERGRSLARRPRLVAALEDNALDLLYPSAADELADVMERRPGSAQESAAYGLNARFYRFLDGKGAVIPPVEAKNVGELGPADEARLALRAVPDEPQTGYLWRRLRSGAETVDEVIAMPIVSTEANEAIAAIVLGLKPVEPGGGRAAAIRSGIWTGGRLFLPSLGTPPPAALAEAVARAVGAPEAGEGGFETRVAGTPHLLFWKRLNPGSLYPAAYEVSLYPLAGLTARRIQLAWQFAGAGALLLLAAFGASRIIAVRLSEPVEKLAVDSEDDRARRRRAEASLELTSQELQKSARFSADASHQLKTPLAVLRAGLEELLAREALSAEAREEVSALMHQTFRLTCIIEDLLLLSRMDAGRLQIEFGPVNLTPLVEAWLDDLSARPDAAGVAVESDLPPVVSVEGEERYTRIILENLLENALKYNRPGGRIRIAAAADGGWTVLSVGNTGSPIPTSSQEHIFERFHRGAVGENIPGYGLGLNLARELARLHRGELRLARSGGDWTEFELRFRSDPAGVAR